jgi:hypothetical protein
MKKTIINYKKWHYAILFCLFLISCNREKHPIGCGFEIGDYDAAIKTRIADGIKSTIENDTVVIRVIFQVIYNNDDENIPTSAILSELKTLNLDFLKANPDTNSVISEYKSRIGNSKIKFVLADTVLTETGIKRTARISRGDLYKSSAVIDSKHYLNVYIGNIKSDGFVYSYPWRNPTTDAVYLYYKWVGGNYRLLTHETGHWLGLWHIFEGKCSISNDGISDTPAQSQATGMDKICDNSARCSSKELPMYNNYMDYSDCRCMFTNEQCYWMRGIIKKFRPDISR